MRSVYYQIALIFLGLVAVAMFAVFLMREIFPEYKIYQNDYIELEKFHSSYSGEPVAAFQEGIKQIVIEKENKGPPIIDRCTSCHVALEVPYFSPTKIAYDINGNILRDAEGNPVQVANDDYVWAKLDEKIAELTDAKVIEHLKAQGESSQADARIKQAKQLESLKTAHVDDVTYDVAKVLTMHPLIGKETRPFEFHPIEEYGCVSCHNGNGRGLTTEKAHGPIFDNQYEIEYLGPQLKFIESDPENDPLFAREFNNKPGDALLFQTTPIFVGKLIQAKCVQCHQSSVDSLQTSVFGASVVTETITQRSQAIKEAFNDEKQALISLLTLKKDIESKGLAEEIASLKLRTQDYSLPSQELTQLRAQLQFLTPENNKQSLSAQDQQQALARLTEQLKQSLGNASLITELAAALDKAKTEEYDSVLDKFFEEHKNDPKATGSIFKKQAAIDSEEKILQQVQGTQASLQKVSSNENLLANFSADIDVLTKDYHQGEEFFISQACYACHRIAGFSRGGVGPDLTRAGKDLQPWYLKRKISWPQGDLPSSTMPNEHLDPEVLEDVMTYLLAQTGEPKTIAPATYKIAIQEWENGRKLPWETPITPAQMHDLRFSMQVFATEGCAACHRLKGYESDVGFAVEKEKSQDFDALYKEKQWFSKLFPEEVMGSEIVATVEANQAEIDKRVQDNVRQGSILEEIESKYPEVLESFYSNFMFAARAKNHHYEKLIAETSEASKKAQYKKELNEWKERINRLRMMYIQEYGLGRLICPRPNWSGIFRSDEWLMEHFRKPDAHSPGSIMPAFPFDDTKFYGLTYMLDMLGIRIRDDEHKIWEHQGFSPELAYEMHCAQCHGENRGGDGPVSLWTYPIPKNLRDADFLRNLTRERVVQSITYGIPGTPMPPWGEVAKDKTEEAKPVFNAQEISLLADWLFAQVPGARVIKGSKDVPKWQYMPEDVLKELKREGQTLPSASQEKPSAALFSLPAGDNYYASLSPVVYVNHDFNINDMFDERPSPIPGPDKAGYYIKKKYYIQENIDAGREFFELNCAVCHGKEADGSGIRAAVMMQAKPMNLTNLDWINTHDDLRLLRSIKYGIPGTAMTPWGDLTTTLQRLQLVIFIRSLTLENERRALLSSTIYQAFESPRHVIEKARVKEYHKLEKTQEEYDQLKAKEEEERRKVESGQGSLEEATKIYQQELELLTKNAEQEKRDNLFVQLKGLLRKESELYQKIGNDLIMKDVDEALMNDFLEMIKLNEGRYKLENDELTLNIDPKLDQKLSDLKQKLIAMVDNELETLNSEQRRLEGELPSAERTDRLKSLAAEKSTFTKTKDEIISNLAEAVRVRQQQIEIFKQLKEKQQNASEKDKMVSIVEEE